MMLTMQRTTCRNLVKTLAEFEYEVDLTYRSVLKPLWDTPPSRNRLPHLLYGCVMWCFARIDLLSTYWKGAKNNKGQSKRMVDFMQTYLGKPRLEASVALKLWRHTLMHTGEPRVLYRKDGRQFSWLHHWGGELPEDQHFVLLEGTPMILPISLIYLIRDLRVGQRKYLANLRQQGSLQRKFSAVDERLKADRFNSY